MSRWSLTQELPFLHHGKVVVAEMSNEGVTFSLKDGGKKSAVPWALIIPWKNNVLYMGQEGDPTLDFTIGPSLNHDA